MVEKPSKVYKNPIKCHKAVKITEKHTKTSKNRKKFAENAQKQSKCLIFIKKTTKMSKNRRNTHKNKKTPSNTPKKLIKIKKNNQKNAKHIPKPLTISENHKKQTKT